VIRLALRVRREQAEIVLAELLELAPGGVEEVELGERGVEYAVYGAPGELPELPALGALAGDALVEVSTTEIPDDWQERWKAFHHPVLIEAAVAPGGDPGEVPAAVRSVPSLHVRPPWEEPHAGPGRIREIVIDPGQAFGTGAHATTRMCLELLVAIACEEEPGGPLLDIGTGFGALAIAGALLGFNPVLGLDNERESVEAAAENALVNGAEIQVRRFDLRSDPLPWLAGTERPARPLLVTANLLRPLLMELSCAIERPPRHLIAGGLLASEAQEISDAFAVRSGLSERMRLQSGEWAALWLTGP
jgi:ribosomal protein L11 methyltransferase